MGRACTAGPADWARLVTLDWRERVQQPLERPQPERWFRQAAEAGDPDAAHGLGRLLEEKGSLAEAEEWSRREGGDVGARAVDDLRRALDPARIQSAPARVSDVQDNL